MLRDKKFSTMLLILVELGKTKLYVLAVIVRTDSIFIIGWINSDK